MAAYNFFEIYLIYNNYNTPQQCIFGFCFYYKEVKIPVLVLHLSYELYCVPSFTGHYFSIQSQVFSKAIRYFGRCSVFHFTER